MHKCNRKFNWEERQGTTEILTADLALPNQCTQTTAYPYFMLTSPPPSVNTPIEDLGCAPAHPACGISSSWKPEPDTVSSLTHPGWKPDSLIQRLTSPSPLSARECADLHLTIQEWTQLRKENLRPGAHSLLAYLQIGSALRSGGLMLVRLQLIPQHTRRKCTSAGYT